MKKSMALASCVAVLCCGNGIAGAAEKIIFPGTLGSCTAQPGGPNWADYYRPVEPKGFYRVKQAADGDWVVLDISQKPMAHGVEQESLRAATLEGVLDKLSITYCKKKG